MANCMFVVTLPKQRESDLDPAHLLEDGDVDEVADRGGDSADFESSGNLIQAARQRFKRSRNPTVSSSDAGVASGGSNIASASSTASGATGATTSLASTAAATVAAVAAAAVVAAAPSTTDAAPSVVSGSVPSVNSDDCVAERPLMPDCETPGVRKRSALKPPQSPLSDRHVDFTLESVTSANALEMHDRPESAASGASGSEVGVDSVDFDQEAANQRSIQRVDRLSKKHKRPLTPTEIVRLELEENSLFYTLTPMSKGIYIQIVCLCPAKTAEALLSRLMFLGIGRRNNTSVNLFHPTVSRAGRDNNNQDTDDDDAEGAVDSKRMQAFMNSMRARLMVSQVYRTVMDKGRWTFDFVCFLICAAIIAAVGLATNSSVNTVASMLLSPFMGPILALTFSWRLKRFKAVLHSVYNTLLASGIIFLTGFLMLFVLIGPLLLLGVSDFPTKEMTDRGQHASLLFGIIVASASAYGVSVSVLQGDHSANVGVAISASLLPPVANSGMLLAYCLMAAFRPPVLIAPADAAASNATAEYIQSLKPPSCSYQHFNQFVFKPTYVCSVTFELLIMSAQSMVLCLLNIVIIVLCSYFWLALKEVAPDRTERSDANREFFSHDIRYARENNECLHGDSRSQLQSEFAGFKKLILPSASSQAAVEKFAERLQDVMADTNYMTICASSRAGPLPLDPSNAKRLARTLSVRQRRSLGNHRAAKSAPLRPLQDASGASSSGTSLSTEAEPDGKRHGRFSVKTSFAV